MSFPFSNVKAQILAGCFCVLFFLGIPTAQASLITHTEAHISNIQVHPSNGGIFWYLNPWFSIAAAGAFDNPSGWDQAYDDDQDFNGEASASASSSFSAASGAASANNLQIDVIIDMNDPNDAFSAISDYAFGELYNVFEITEATPVDVTFSFDYAAELFGSATGLRGFDLNYGINMVLSDGIQDWVLETSHVLSGSNTTLSFSDTNTLTQTITIQPFTLYSIDFIVDSNPKDVTVVPEPATISLLSLGVIGFLWLGRNRTKAGRERKSCQQEEV